MREDTRTCSEADAGAYARAHDGGDYDRTTYADVADDDRLLGPITAHQAMPLPEVMRVALCWPYAREGYDRQPQETAPGVAAFPLVDSDDVEKMTSILDFVGVETRVLDGILYGRRVAEEKP